MGEGGGGFCPLLTHPGPLYLDGDDLQQFVISEWIRRQPIVQRGLKPQFGHNLVTAPPQKAHRSDRTPGCGGSGVGGSERG